MKTPLRLLLASALPLHFAVVSIAGSPPQLPKIFVASFGNDANDGSRGAPKRNFQPAHDAVAAGGQIVVLDTAGYGAFNITKNIAVTVPPGVNGFVTVTGNGNGITVNAGSTSVVALRGLIVEGGGASTSGNGILATSVGTLVIEDCTVRNFNEGIYVFPANSAQVSIYDTTVRSCSYGFDIENAAAAAVVVVSATRCRVEGCDTRGVLAYAATSGGSVDVTLDNCTVRGNAAGLTAQATNTSLRASGCTIVGNNTGVQVISSGFVISRGNNTLENNTNGNAFPFNYNAK